MKAERGVSLADENLSIESPGAANFCPAGYQPSRHDHTLDGDGDDDDDGEHWGRLRDKAWIMSIY
jgi:hypothetical protein